MSRTYLLAGLASLLLLSATFAVAPPPPAVRAAVVNRLIEQLGDRDFRVRDQAEQQLHALGQPVLPYLRRAMGHRDLEIRRRAVRLVPGLENAALFSPKRITLKVRNQNLNQVLEALSKASGYKVVNQAGGMVFIPIPVPVPAGPPARVVETKTPREKTFTYDFVNTPFWDVVERVCRDCNLSVQQSWGDDTIRLYPAQRYAPFTGRSGPFRYVASNFQLYRNVDLSTANNDGPGLGRSENLTLNFTVFAEPRLPFMGMGEVRMESAYDDLRNSMLIRTTGDPNNPWGGGPFMGRRFYGGNYKQLTMQVSVNLERRSEKATMLKLVKGVVPMTVLVHQRPVVISDKILTAKGVKKTVGDLEFNVHEVKKMPNGQVQVRFTVSNKVGNDYTWQNNMYNRVEMQDDKGNKFNIWGTSWGGSGPNSMTLTLTYGSGGPANMGTPARFVFMHWETKQHDVAFEFRNVPLP